MIIVVCKKPLQKTPNIKKNESILKTAKIRRDAKAIAFAKWSVWVKNETSQKGAKNNCTTTWELFCAKTRFKKLLFSKNEGILKMAKIGHDAKAIAFAKWSVWVRNKKYQIRADNDCTTTLELFSAKKRTKTTKYSKNNSILEMAKIGHDARAIAFTKWSREICSVQKSAPKNT